MSASGGSLVSAKENAAGRLWVVSVVSERGHFQTSSMAVRFPESSHAMMQSVSKARSAQSVVDTLALRKKRRIV